VGRLELQLRGLELGRLGRRSCVPRGVFLGLCLAEISHLDVTGPLGRFRLRFDLIARQPRGCWRLRVALRIDLGGRAVEVTRRQLTRLACIGKVGLTSARVSAEEAAFFG